MWVMAVLPFGFDRVCTSGVDILRMSSQPCYSRSIHASWAQWPTPWLTGTAMPLDPRAQRLLSMVAATGPENRGRPSPEQRRLSLKKLMQFARNDCGAVTTQDGQITGPAGSLPYRL